jgi:hypothetical protein
VSEVPLEIRVRWEIWESFVSLLNSYAAANGPDYKVHKLSDWAAVEYKDRAIRFHFNPVTGEAVWRAVYPDQEFTGSFQINQDGTFGFEGVDKPIDLAAVDWIAGLKKEPQFDSSVFETILESIHEPRDRDHL